MRILGVMDFSLILIVCNEEKVFPFFFTKCDGNFKDLLLRRLTAIVYCARQETSAESTILNLAQQTLQERPMRQLFNTF